MEEEDGLVLDGLNGVATASSGIPGKQYTT